MKWRNKRKRPLEWENTHHELLQNQNLIVMTLSQGDVCRTIYQNY